MQDGAGDPGATASLDCRGNLGVACGRKGPALKVMPFDLRHAVVLRRSSRGADHGGQKSHIETSGEKSVAGQIHVSWNGAVGDLNEYFGKNDSVKKHLNLALQILEH